MKKNYYLLITIVFLSFQLHQAMALNNLLPVGCSVAGTASLVQDSICYEDTTMLSLTGYVGTIQWQSYDGITWNNESGIGATTDAYSLAPGETKQYRAVVTNAACAADTSNTITITVGTIPVPAGFGAARCGPGQVTVTGVGSGTMQWYSTPTGGGLIGTGSPFTTYVPITTTLYLADNVDGGTGSTSPLMITEMEVSGDDFIEIQNVSNQPVDVTGWMVVASNVYGDINAINPNIQTLSGILQPGDLLQFSDNSTTPNSTYWGSNLLFNPGSYPTFTGWVMILDTANTPREFLALNWLASDIQGMSPLINGVNISIDSSTWSGDGVDITNTSISAGIARQGNMDNNTNTDFAIITPNLGSTNVGLVLPFTGFGCSSPRIPVNVTIGNSEAVTINAAPPALCQGLSTTLTATSNNVNYNYTWSPATALSSTTGNMVTATPLSPISYIVVADDGTCAARDTVFINVGPASLAGTASYLVDTICLGNSTTLSLSGNVGTIQWQSNAGAGWVNETGSGFNAQTYIITPTVSADYRAVVTSGGCDADTTIVLPITVLSIIDPVVSNITACANDTVTVSATGSGVIGWYSYPVSGSEIGSGATFSTYIIGDTTFYAQAKGGVTFHPSPIDNTFGSSAQSATDGYGLGFSVARLSTLEKVFVYAQQTGNVIIKLRNTLGGPVLDSVVQYVTASSAKTAISLQWILNPGTYRIEIATGSVILKYNYNGATYPYTDGNSPITINGYLSPGLNTGIQYLYFYDWVVFEGCTSNRVPLSITTTPAQPTISQVGTLLFSSAATGNQWYLNGGLIAGANSQTLVITQTGLYSVAVTVAGCTANGQLNVTFIGMDELQSAGISVYPNPVSDKLIIRFDNDAKNNIEVRLMDATGALVMEKTELNNVRDINVDTQHLAQGTYLLELKVKEAVYRKTIVKN